MLFPEAPSALQYLECPECGGRFDPDRLQGFCQACRSPLLARYDLDGLRGRLSPEGIGARKTAGRGGLWRWAELLPVRDPAWRLSLGEGDTPLLRVDRLGAALGLPNLFVKDESLNPTATFKARGLAVAVARAAELGARAFVIPTAGNAGGALAAYAARASAAARAGCEAHVYMPQDAPPVNRREVEVYGAGLRLVDGLIGDAGRQAAADGAGQGWLDVSTFKEPYRVEGKKTMGLELAEAFGWRLPDVILYPTGGGTGLVGMWKAFAELEALGWIGPGRPRLVSVQAAGCAPVVRAFHSGAGRIDPWPGAQTLAAGLRVPAPFADRLILRALRESGGTAISVDDEEILEAQRELARLEGIFAAPEGAAAVAALKHLDNQTTEPFDYAQGTSSQSISPSDTIVIFNTGSGLKYVP